MTTYPALYLNGIECFNRGAYFESHELWEELWRAENGPAREFYKGLIQAAVALHHLGRGNPHGASKMLSGSHAYLNPYRPQFLGLDVDQFLTQLTRHMAGRTPTRCQIEDVQSNLAPRIQLSPPASGDPL